MTVRLRKHLQLRNYETEKTTVLQNTNQSTVNRQNSGRSIEAAIVNPFDVFQYKPSVLFNDVSKSWLEKTRLYLKKSSYSTYDTIVSTHLQPHFGNMAISEITTEQVSTFLADLSRLKELAPSTVRGIASVLRSVMKHAETEGYEIKTKGCVVRRKEPPHKARILSDPEWKQLEISLTNDPDTMKLGMLICMYTGLRLGEICALKWEDISLDEGILTVNRTIQRIKNTVQQAEHKTVIIIDSPKSQSSIRAIPLPSLLLGMMKKFETANNCFVLTGDSTAYVEPRTLQNHFKQILHQSGIEDINFHAIRHTFATKCVNLGFDIKALSDILGHSDVSVTLNTYVHPSLNVMKSYMERFNNL